MHDTLDRFKGYDIELLDKYSDGDGMEQTFGIAPAPFCAVYYIYEGRYLHRVQYMTVISSGNRRH